MIRITILIFLLSCSQESSNQLETRTEFQDGSGHYTFSGEISNIENGAILYLSNMIDQVDSVQVQNNRFQFEGEIAHPQMYKFYGKTLKENVLFWLEGASIELNVDNLSDTKFREKITGSKSHDEFLEMGKTIKFATITPEQIDDYISKHRASYISIFLLDGLKTRLGKRTSLLFFNRLDSRLFSSLFGKSLRHYLDLDYTPLLGDKYSDFEQKTPDGKAIKLSDFDGKTILLDFWGTWCAPCREANPKLLELYNEYREQGFEILSIAADTDINKWKKVIAADKMIWKHASDLKGIENRAALRYDISSYPTYFLINSDGIIISKTHVFDDIKSKVESIF